MPPPASPRLRCLPPPHNFTDIPFTIAESQCSSILSVIQQLPDDIRNSLVADLVSQLNSEDATKVFHQRRIHEEAHRISTSLATSSVPSIRSLESSLIDVVSVCSPEKSQCQTDKAGSVYLNYALHEHFGRKYAIGPNRHHLEITGYMHQVEIFYLTGSMIEHWYIIGASYGSSKAIAKTVIYDDPGRGYQREHHVGMKSLLENVAADLGLVGQEEELKGLMELFWESKVVNGWHEEGPSLIEIVLKDIETEKMS
jgi:hypothetical protein